VVAGQAPQPVAGEFPIKAELPLETQPAGKQVPLPVAAIQLQTNDSDMATREPWQKSRRVKDCGV